MQIKNKYIIVALDGFNDGHSVYIENVRTGNHLTMSKDESYELWIALSQLYEDYNASRKP